MGSRQALVFQQVLDWPGRGTQTSRGLHSIPFLARPGNPRLPPVAITCPKHLSTIQVGTVFAMVGLGVLETIKNETTVCVWGEF